MKKLFLIFAMAIVVAACGTKTVEEQAEAKLEQIVKTFEEGDAVKAGELLQDFATWGDGLSEEDQQKVAEVGERYALQITLAMAGMNNLEEDWSGGYDENEESEQSSEEVTAKAQEYCDKIVKALKKGDLDKAEDLMDDMDDWQDSLNDEEWDKVEDIWVSYEEQIDELFYEIEEY